MTQLRKQLATCEQRLSQYRAALNAGADPVQVAKWINETEQERARLEGEVSAVPVDRVISRDGLAELLQHTGELARAVVDARPGRQGRALQETRAEDDVLPAETTRGSQGGPDFHMC
ncbi:hypothetical protein [Actinomadura pelletieri]|uniref:hypothetical protein n=1 Tax=Actinomadura pelletieri TaxID=111805 RepID=UPI0011C470AC|nr:hypothetical protein [Actinomadura pelletieri]